jgi:RHS repeat-associated protein
MLCRAPTSATTCVGSNQTGAALRYDSEDRLVSWHNDQSSSPASTDYFLYDGAGNRVEQLATISGTSTTTAYVGSLEEISVTGSTTTTSAYYAGVVLSVNGALSYTLSDGLGSVTVAVSTSGVVMASQLYGPYGSVRYSNGTMPGTKAYTGQRADAVTGLDYYGARYYDPLAGQFTSADSSTADGLNRYAYVGGNPETATDPTGHMLQSQGSDYNPEEAQAVDVAWHISQQAPVYLTDHSHDLADTLDFLTGYQTLSQSYHTLFQDPHASLAQKAQAALAAYATGMSDTIAIASLFIGQPEIGEGARAVDGMLLTTTDGLDGMTAAVSSATDATVNAATTDAEPSLLRTGTGGGAGYPPIFRANPETVIRTASKYGIDISESEFEVRPVTQGYDGTKLYGNTMPNRTILLYRDAFDSEEQLMRTLVHEKYHVAQLKAGMPYPPNFNADSPVEIAATQFEEGWWAGLETLDSLQYPRW